MKFTAIKTTWTDSMKHYAKSVLEGSLAKTDIDIEKADIKVTAIKNSIKVDLAVDGFIVQNVDEDFYVALATAATKLKQLAVKRSKKYLANRTKNYNETELFECDPLTTRDKILILSPSTLDKAIEEFDQTDFNFYAYKDVDTSNEVSILYRRKDDTIGVIHCR